jgi:VWFA-related protein
MGVHLTVLLAGALAGASEDGRSAVQAPLVVRLGVDLVQVDAMVTDKKGRAVTDLVAADFEVLQDGRPQVVSQAAYMGKREGTGSPRAAAPGPDSGEPASPEAASEAIVLVVDDLLMSTNAVDATRRALLGFAGAMEEDAQVFLLRTAGRVVDIQPLAGPADLRAAARALRHQRLPWASNLAEASPRQAAAYQLVQATNAYLNSLARRSLLTIQAITDALRSWRGRKTLVLFSEGFPIWDPPTRERVGALDLVYGRAEDVLGDVDRLTDIANRASVVIHTVDPRGLVTAGFSAQDATRASHSEIVNTLQTRRSAIHSSQGSLARVAEQTGGLAVLNTNDLGSGLARIVADSRSYYLVGYEPAPETFAPDRPRFHRLEVRVKRRGLKVRSRKGFFGMSDAAVAALAPPQAF